jgi:cell division protein FtsB
MIFDDDFKKYAEILNQRFYLLLEEFKKDYLLYKENESYQVNKNKFEKSKNNLQQFYADIVLLDNKVEIKTKQSTSSLKDDKKRYEELKKRNDFLKTNITNLENGDLTTEQMYKDTQNQYVQRYARFFIIFFGLIVLCMFTYLVIKDESYELDMSNMSFSRKILTILSIIIFILFLAGKSLGFNVFQPLIDFFEERGFFNQLQYFSINI